MIAEGTDAGVFHAAERELLEGVIRFADRPLRTIMVPRHAMVWIDAERPARGQRSPRCSAAGHSRFPLCAGDDRRADRLRPRQGHPRAAAPAAAATSASVARAPLYVIESLPALRMIELFRTAGIHLAIVVDEYGSLEGIVTPTDILTGIAGDLPDQGDDGRAGRRPARGRLAGSSTAACRSTPPPASSAARPWSAGDYATLAGLVIEELGHLPTAGEQRRPSHGWCFEVVDLDGRRIDKLLASRPDGSKPGGLPQQRPGLTARADARMHGA